MDGSKSIEDCLTEKNAFVIAVGSEIERRQYLQKGSENGSTGPIEFRLTLHGNPEIFHDSGEADAIVKGLGLLMRRPVFRISVSALFAGHVRVSDWSFTSRGTSPPLHVWGQYVPWLVRLLKEAFEAGYVSGGEAHASGVTREPVRDWHEPLDSLLRPK